MRFYLLSFSLLMVLGVSGGCLSPGGADRLVGYGGRPWSLAEIFPPGPHRDLAAAAARDDLRGIDRSIAAGAEVNFRGAHDFTPLWWAAWDQNFRGFQRLLELGADPNVVPTEEYSVMTLTAEAFVPLRFLRAALAHGGDPNLGGRTPLISALQRGTPAHVHLLLESGADVNGRSARFGGPLFAAVGARRYDYVYLLLQRGADPTAKRVGSGRDLADMIGMFPYDPNSDGYVWRERVIRFLRERGIDAQRPANERLRTKPLPPDLQ